MASMKAKLAVELAEQRERLRQLEAQMAELDGKATKRGKSRRKVSVVGVVADGTPQSQEPEQEEPQRKVQPVQEKQEQVSRGRKRTAKPSRRESLESDGDSDSSPEQQRRSRKKSRSSSSDSIYSRRTLNAFTGAGTAEQRQQAVRTLLFHLKQIEPAEKRLKSARALMEEDAMVWYERQEREEGWNWERFEQGITARFVPNTTVQAAMAKLMELRMGDSLDEFTRVFNKAMDAVGPMSEEHKIAMFRKGLTPKLREKLAHFSFKSLHNAQDQAVESDDVMQSSKPKAHLKAMAAGQAKSGQGHGQARGGQGQGQGQKRGPQKGCWTCGGDHYQRDCTQAGKVLA